jgi:hypothetical protein
MVGLNGRGYMIEPSLYRRSLVPVQRDPRDDTPEPGEQSLSPTGIWRRSQSDWSYGAGQLWLDGEDSRVENPRRRFYRSLGIDAFSNQFEATLNHSTTERRNSANTNLKLVSTGDRLYYMDGTNVAFSDTVSSEQNLTWTTNWTAATGLPGGSQLDIVFWGSHVLVLGSDNSIYSAATGVAAFTLLFNGAAAYTRIWVALGRLFASANNGILYEITSPFGAPAESIVFTHPNSNFRIRALVGTPTGIYFGGSIGRNGEIRYTKVNTAGSAFDAPYVTAEFRNEEVYAFAVAGNNLLIGTTQGFRYAPLDQASPGLDFGPVVTTPGHIQEMAVDNADAETFVWFTWTNLYGTGNSGLGRIRPARFAEPAVPAYISDIYTASSATVLSVASLRDRRYFALSADGFYGEDANFVTSGTLETGRLRYGILDTKVFADIQWRSLSLPEDAQIDALVTTASGQEIQTNPQSMAGTTDSGVMSLGPAFSEWAEVEFTLRRGDAIMSALYSDSTGSATTPDIAAYAITDLEVIVRVSLPSWTPGGFGRVFMDQWAPAANQGWLVGIDGTGHLLISTSSTGANTVPNVMTTVVPFTGGDFVWIKYSLDVNDGAGNRVATFQTSPDGIAWTVLGVVTTAGTTTIFNSTASLRVGGLLTGTGMAVSQAKLNASIGGAEVANPNFEPLAPGTTSFTDAATRVWTVNAPATVAQVPGTDATAPTLTSWVMRAIPSPTTVTQFLVPIILRHKVLPNHGPLRMVHSDHELENLGSLVSSQAIVSYQEGHAAYDVHVVNFEVQGVLWDRTANHLETLVLVQLHTLR